MTAKNSVIIAFESGSGFLDSIVKLFTLSKFSHCYSFDRVGRGTIEALPSGVVHYWDREGRNIEKVAVFIDNPDGYAYFLEKQIGKAYDFSGVASFLFPFIKQDAKKWYCSELIAEALIHGGMDRKIFYPNGRGRISPKKLYQILKGINHVVC